MREGKRNKKQYYIGLDCGTHSVGWAVTDEKYNLLRARGQNLWGVRLFEEAKTAEERRLARSNRRRTARAKQRIKLLQMLFADEIVKVDPDFYIRLKESFFLEEDKRFGNTDANSKNTLFNDPDYQDKDYHKAYPTIWHLRKAIIDSANDDSGHYDIRLYYLAIEHIIKHRGHFLREGELHGAGIFKDLWTGFCDAAETLGISVARSSENQVENLLKSSAAKTDKKSQLNSLIFEQNSEYLGDTKELAGLMIGSKVSLRKIFTLDAEEDLKLSFDEGSFEDLLPKIEEYLGSLDGAIELVLAAKQIFDYIYLSDLLDGGDSVSAAMVKNYDQHQTDLKALKVALKPFKEDYNYFFKTVKTDQKEKKPGNIFYAAYIGNGYTQDANGRRSSFTVSQEELNKEILRLLEKHHIGGDLKTRAENGTLLPKQKGFAKGTIPQQLHHNELKLILKKLERDFPSFAKETTENVKYNTKSKKIEAIHSFRIPYYCGPMLSSTEKQTQFSWADAPISQVVYPWNYAELVNLGERANKFISRMTNDCTYVVGADVLPKNSLTYQKYMVLNELNNLKVNGKRIDNPTKLKIYEHGFADGELKGNIMLKRLAKWCHTTGILNNGDELSGASEVSTFPKLSTHADLKRILGEDYAKKYSQAKLEQVVNLITILSNEREMLQVKIQSVLGCSEVEAEKLSRLNYHGWGRFSDQFLRGVHADVDGRTINILEALQETPNNLMELLGSDFGFKQALDDFNHNDQPVPSDITYEMVEELYCSPAVKRTVWQAIKIIQEIIKVMGYPPAKIFLEVTRGKEKSDQKVKLARRKDLLEKYRKIEDHEAKELCGELNNFEDRDLQSKKLFLYYQQMGKCAYCGEHINLEEINNSKLYDVDHIYPRSKTKDDSITRNLVLVHAHENREKTNIYPIGADIRKKMHGVWKAWRDRKLITEEKYARLTRADELTPDELAGFISRQLVETSQSVKAIRDLVAQHLPDTKVIMVKGGNVSDLRKFYGYQGDPKNNLPIMPQFIKIRDLNDLHHAKDAYLNIVVGNVINSTYTDNPFEWVQRKKDTGYKYSILTKHLFRNSETYKKSSGGITNFPEVKAWDFADSVRIVAETLKRNDVIWTKMAYEQSGAISDLQIVGKSEKTEGILPIKQDARLAHTEKYGGYNSVSGAYFSLIECPNGSRIIAQIPIVAKHRPEEYLRNVYGDIKVIISKINFKSLLKINGFPYHLASRSGKYLRLHPAIQIKLSGDQLPYLKKICSFNQKIIADKKYELSERDGISASENLALFDTLAEKLQLFASAPTMGPKIREIITSKNKFVKLDEKTQAVILYRLLQVMACNDTKVNLSDLVDGAKQYGTIQIPTNIEEQDNIQLIIQSVTGLYERIINLKTVQPGEF